MGLDLFLQKKCWYNQYMKDKIPIKKTKLPYHRERNFFAALKMSAKEHGYIGLFSKTRFLFRRLLDYIHQSISIKIPINSVKIKHQKKRGVKIGENVHIGPNVFIDEVFPNFLTIGDNVSIAGNNYILTHTKPLEYHKELFESSVSPVIIKKNAWIAIGVIILPGVIIGEGAVVAAGSVVTRDVPAHTFAAGVPAKVVKKYKVKNGVPFKE